MQQQRGHIPGGKALERVENDRMMGHDELAAVQRGLLHHGGGDVQRGGDGGDGTARVHQQAHVVPVAGQFGGGKLLQNFQHLLGCVSHGQFLSSFNVRMSASSRAACAGSVTPRRYFSSLTHWAAR